MNKAFVREPDQIGDCCPRCGSKGEPVSRDTLRHQLTEEVRSRISDSASFCPSPKCDVVYFDCFEQFVLTTDLRRPVYPKSQDAPICACFGLTREDIEQDVWEGVTTRVKAALERAKSPAACCSKMAANGRSCVSYVQKYYMQCRSRQKQ